MPCRVVGWVALCLAACSRAEPVGETDTRFPEDWQPDPVEDDSGEAAVGFRLTIEAATGPVSLAAVDEAGLALQLTAAMGFDADGDGVEELYASDGTSAWRLDPETLRFGEPVAWLGPDGSRLAPDLLSSGRIGGIDYALGTFGSDLRVWDFATGRWSEAVALSTPDASGLSTEPFVPVSLAVAPVGAGIFVALGADGAFYAELSPLVLSRYLAPPDTCSDSTPIRGSVLVVANLPDEPGPLGQALLIVDGEQLYAQEQVRCFHDAVGLRDDDDGPIAPRFALGVDLDGDGSDELVWGHP